MNLKKGNKELCPKCETGRDTYLLDSKASFCPYLSMHNGSTCAKFRPMKKSSDPMTKSCP